jgi:hypothetical protein
MVYFVSWLLPLLTPASGWSGSSTDLLALRVTVYLSFLGIVLIGSSWLWGVIAAVFIISHTRHGLQNLIDNTDAWFQER